MGMKQKHQSHDHRGFIEKRKRPSKVECDNVVGLSHARSTEKTVSIRNKEDARTKNMKGGLVRREKIFESAVQGSQIRTVNRCGNFKYQAQAWTARGLRTHRRGETSAEGS